MNTVPDNLDPSLLAAGYALGTLTTEEVAAYEAHLAGSAEARQDAWAHEQTAIALGLDAEPVQPRPESKANLLALIQTTPQDAPTEATSHVDVITQGTGTTTTDVATTDTAGAGVQPGPVRNREHDDRAVDPIGQGRHGAHAQKARARWFTRPVAVMTAAAAAAALFFGGALIGQQIGAPPAPELQQASALAQITSAADTQRASAAVSGGGTATLVWSLDLGKSAILVDGLSTLPPDKTYELWYIRGEVAQAAGTMDATGTVTWRVLDGAIQAGDTVGITVEPAGGSPQPTTTPVVAIAS